MKRPGTDDPNCHVFHLLFRPSSDITPLQRAPVAPVSAAGELTPPPLPPQLFHLSR